MNKYLISSLIALFVLAFAGTNKADAQPRQFAPFQIMHFDSSKSSNNAREWQDIRRADPDTTKWENLADLLDDLGLNDTRDSALYYAWVPEPAADGPLDSISVALTIQFGTDLGFGVADNGGVTVDTSITFTHETLGQSKKSFIRKLGDLLKASTHIRVITDPQADFTPAYLPRYVDSSGNHSGAYRYKQGLVATKQDP